jgi:S-layer homology domain
MTCRSRLVVGALAGLALATTACQPPLFFPEFVVSTSEPGDNEPGGAAIGNDGDFVVTWMEGVGTDDVLGRRFDAETTPLGGAFPVNADTVPQRFDPSIARDASGRFVIVWNDITSAQIRGRRFASDGTPLGADFQVSTSTPDYVHYPFVASDPSGNFAVVWRVSVDGNLDVIARRFDSHGAPLGNEFTVNAFTLGDQRPWGIAMSKTGLVVTWTGDGVGGELGIFGRRFDAAGAPTAGFQINTDPILGLARPTVAMNAAGDFVVVWEEGLPQQVAFGRRFDTAGAPLGDVFPISQGTVRSASRPRVASDAAGNFLVAWASFPQSGAEIQIHARFFDIGGEAASDEFQVNAVTTHRQVEPHPSLADDGSFVVAFKTGLNDLDQVKGRKSAVRAAPEIVVDADPGLASSPGAAPGNGVFEPGETQILKTAWVNDSSTLAVDVFSQSELFTGPPGAEYTLNVGLANYDTFPAGQTTSCVDPDCFSVTVSAPAVRPIQHWDALLQENFSLSIPHTWVLHIGESFPDVTTAHQFYRFIETLFHNGVTQGCAGGGYCPGNAVTRAQMAVFLLKSKLGEAHVPPPCTGTVFTDVPCTGGSFDPWIEELAGLQITGGCGNANYCPNNTVTRQQMAVFLLKALEGSAYVPPTCAGVFDDVACPSQFADWIEELADRAITGGCSVTPPLYCPTNPNNRGQMAVFLVKTFGLVLYGG